MSSSLVRGRSSLVALVAFAAVGCQYPSTSEPLGGGATILVRERMERSLTWSQNTIHRHVTCADGRELLHHLSDWSPTSEHALARETARPLQLVLVDLRRCRIAWTHVLDQPGYAFAEWNAQGTQAALYVGDEIMVLSLEPRPMLVPVVARERPARSTFITVGPDGVVPAWSPSGTRLLVAERNRASRPAGLTRLGCWSPAEGLHMSSEEPDDVVWLTHTCWESAGTRSPCPHAVREADCAAVAAALLPAALAGSSDEPAAGQHEPTSRH